MVSRSELCAHLDSILAVDSFQDYCPNGLQVEGKSDIQVLVSGVTASKALIDAAISVKADAILVHHGFFWKGEDPRIVGIKRRRIQQLLAHGVNLFAYHLPLDGHPQYGNNAQLAEILGIAVDGFVEGTGNPPLALHGAFMEAKRPVELNQHIEEGLGRVPLHIAGAAEQIKTIGWCTGAAQCYLEQAAFMGLDAYISGEISEQTTHLARELGIHYYAAGHHATERYGVQALGQYLEKQFSLSHRFIEVGNPV